MSSMLVRCEMKRGRRKEIERLEPLLYLGAIFFYLCAPISASVGQHRGCCMRIEMQVSEWQTDRQTDEQTNRREYKIQFNCALQMAHKDINGLELSLKSAPFGR